MTTLHEAARALLARIDRIDDRLVRGCITTITPELNRLRAALAAESERVSVPREPTEAMMQAGDDAIIDGLQKGRLGIPYGLHPEHACWNVYRAMLAAAEKEPRP